MTEAVLFDVDGTLIDSNDAHARAWSAAFSEAGYTVSFDRIRPLIGMGGDRVLPALVGGLSVDAEPGASIAAARGKIFVERELHAVQPMRSARALLEAVRARGARVVVATSAKRGELDLLLARGGLGPLINVASTSDDADASKPAPDIVEAALKKVGVAVQNAIMVGDTRYDIEAAHRAGIACVALRCGGNDPATLRHAEAVYSDPAELVGALDRQPFTWSSAATVAP